MALQVKYRIMPPRVTTRLHPMTCPYQSKSVQTVASEIPNQPDPRTRGDRRQSSLNGDLVLFLESLTESLKQVIFQRAVLSRPSSETAEFPRVDMRLVRLKSGEHLQVARRTKTQEFHTNIPLNPSDFDTSLASLEQLLSPFIWQDFRIVGRTAIVEYSKQKNTLWKSRRKEIDDSASLTTTQSDHNRKRAYLIPDGTPVPFLVHTGIMTESGQVRARHYHKFRQINRYLEFIHDVVDSLPQEGLRVVDFGSGKSYLTFATHHLIKQILNRDCEIVGLDRRADVVATCEAIARKLNLAGIRFEVGEIAGYQPSGAVHLAISLHACDTATDDAIQQAVAWEANVILAVPCCQHELAGVMAGNALPVLTEHGILRERFAAMTTDAMRAEVLDGVGYDASLIEFIDMEHTPKNILIRAIRRKNATDATRRQSAIERLTHMRHLLNIPPLKLERMLLPS
ncbi:MAG: SAM-dependent methyltransferase [Planctomycetaceae bacterium]|nr:SAM-dependent methyltransferase [Planctomycetaceae bacterium]